MDSNVSTTFCVFLLFWGLETSWFHVHEYLLLQLNVISLVVLLVVFHHLGFIRVAGLVLGSLIVWRINCTFQWAINLLHGIIPGRRRTSLFVTLSCYLIFMIFRDSVVVRRPVVGCIYLYFSMYCLHRLWWTQQWAWTDVALLWWWRF